MEVMPTFYVHSASKRGIISFMNSEIDHVTIPSRVIAVVLSEDEWRAFRAIEPQPVAWMHQIIRDRLQAETPVVPTKAHA
jgi:hypothetical protein